MTRTTTTMSTHYAEDGTDQVFARTRHNEFNAMRTLSPENPVHKIALLIDDLQRARGLSHEEAVQVLRIERPALFRTAR